MTKVAVVLGASGGIGNATCDALSAEYQVLPITREEIDLANNLSYNKICAFLHDVQPDLIVNCAGHFADNTETHSATMDINFGSNWSIIKHYLTHPPTKPVKIIMVGSSAYREGRKKYMLYAASKAALYNLWLSSAEYFQSSNVTVSLINPVKTKTKMMVRTSTKFILPEDVAQKILAMSLTVLSECIDLEYSKES